MSSSLGSCLSTASTALSGTSQGSTIGEGRSYRAVTSCGETVSKCLCGRERESLLSKNVEIIKCQANLDKYCI